MPDWSPPGTRDADEIAQIIDHRADRAIRHVTALAWGQTQRLCPVCDYEGMFSPVRHKPEIWCPQCDSRPRHRLLKLWMDREMDLDAGAEVLHFAAEPWVRRWFEERGARYVTADLNDKFDVQLDITAIDLPDGSRDLVMANHVLEHVDDIAALAEIFRVLRPGGQAVITVPMIEGWDTSFEDPDLRSDAERKLYYGDPTHVRFYGRDIRQRIRRAGFSLSTYVASEPDATRHALHRGERIFIGRKPGASIRADIRRGVLEDAAACAGILNDWIDATEWMPRCHSHADVVGHYRSHVLPEQQVWVAEVSGRVVAFLALAEDRTVTALYVAAASRGAGLGTALLDAAGRACPLRLWTFAVNHGARLFYLRRGFHEARRTDGENEEGLPDILFERPAQ
ncbi:MAG: GNAT family N-acetyltransferase [Pseudomonadota bacterium]